MQAKAHHDEEAMNVLEGLEDKFKGEDMMAFRAIVRAAAHHARTNEDIINVSK